MLQPRRKLLLWTVAAILLSALVECSPDSSGGRHGLPERPKRDSADVTTVLLVEGRGRFQDKPEGLLTSTARTFVQEGTTTEFATQVLGTRLDNGRVYARVLSTSSRVFYDGRDVARKSPPSLPAYLADIVRPTLVFPAQAVQQTVEPFGSVKSGQVYQTAVNDAQSKYSPAADVITVAAIHHVETPPQHHTRYFNVDDPIHKDTFAEEEFASKAFAQKQQLNNDKYSGNTDDGEDSYNLINAKKMDFFKRNVDKHDQNRANYNDLKPSKVVRPLDDLPTFTVRHEFSPSGFSSDEDGGATESRNKDPWANSRIRNGKALFRNGVLMPDQRKLDTVTYMGFADFTTTVGDTVIVFMPNTASLRHGAGRKATSISGDATLPASRRLVTSVKTFMSHTPAMATRTVTGHSLSMQTTIPTMVVLPETTPGRPRKNKAMDAVYVIEAVTEQEDDVQPDPVTDKETYLSREQGHFESAPEQPEYLEPSVVTSDAVELASDVIDDVSSLIYQPPEVIEPSEIVTEAASQEVEYHDEEQTATEAYTPSATAPLTSYRTAQTQLLPIADQEFPLGLIKVIGGTEVVNGTTTLFTSLVYGTSINGEYVQTVHSASSVFFYIGETKVNMEVRKDIQVTSTVQMPHTTSTATTLQEEPEYTTPQPTVPSTEEEPVVFTEKNSITTLQRGTTESNGIATTNGEKVGTTFGDDTLSTIPMDETTTPEMYSELSNEVETGRKVFGHSKDQVITEGNQELTTPKTVEEKPDELGTTNQDVISTTPSEVNQDVLILSSGDYITRLIPSTIYKTFTYLTTFFIPAEGTTTTSVRSREVITSDVTFLTHIVNATVHGNTNDLFTSSPTTTQIEGTLQTISPESIETPKPSPLDEGTTLAEEFNTSPTPPMPTTTEEDLELIYKTLYTTYTYLTTFFEESTTSVASREVVITNVLTSTLGHDFLLQASDPAVAGLFAREDTTVSPMASEISPSPTSVGIGRPTEKHFPDSGNNPDENLFSSVIDSVDIEKEMGATPLLKTDDFDPSAFDVVKTFYTTYTYFTTILVDGETTVSSRTAIYTNVVSPSVAGDVIKPTAVDAVPQLETDQLPQQNVEDATRIESPSFRSTPRMTYNSTITRDRQRSAMNEVEDPDDLLASNAVIRNDDENSIFVTKNPIKYESEYATISRSHVESVTSRSKSPISSRDVMVLSSAVAENPIVVETMSTDVRSSTSGGDKVMMLDRNDKNVLLEDQISSESNTEELHPSPTLLLQTSFTTFTYFTTVYKGSSSSDVISRLETVTNVVTETITPHRTVLPSAQSVAVEDSSLPITYFTTFTYWTTLFKDATTTVTSREETVSEVVTPTATPTVTEEIVPTATLEKELEPTTYYTTFTYYTTSYIDNSTVLNSRLETVTNIVNGTDGETNDLTGRAIGTSIAGQLPPADPSKTESGATLPTGLLSTIMSSSVDNGTTTLFSTDVYGAYIDGLYAKIQESSTQVVTPTPAPVVDLQPTGVISLNEGKIIDADGVSTTYFTTQAVGMYIDQLYAQVIKSTTSVKVDTERQTALQAVSPSTEASGKTFKTGLVRLIEGSIVKDKTTTYYESKVVGTIVDGRYAQIIVSTSSFKVAVSSTTVPADILPTSTQDSGSTVTSTELPSTTPSSVVIESSLIEEGEKSEKDEGEEVDEEDGDVDQDEDDDRDPDKSGKKPRPRSRIRFSPTKNTFTPVIRPFISRNRPTFQPPRRKASAVPSATTITRTTLTPTITATPAAKTEGRSRFTGNRRQSSSHFNSGANEIRPTASSSRRFSRLRGSSTAGGGFSSSSYGGGGRGRSSGRITPTATSGPAGSSRRGGYFRSSSARGGSSELGGRGSSSAGYHSSSRFRIRPTQSARGFNSAIYTTPSSDETLSPENDLTTIVTEETPQYTETADGETPTLPIQTTTESTRRGNNPLLRFRRPPVPRVTPVTSTTPKPTTAPVKKNNLLRPASNRGAPATPRSSTRVRPTQPSRYTSTSNRRPANALFPPRGLFKRPGQDEEEEKQGEDEGDNQDETPEEEDHQEEEEEEIGDNDYEGSETSEAKTSASKRVKPLNQVQIRPFVGFKRRTRSKRQADYGTKSNSGSPRSYSSRFRRPGSSTSRKSQAAAQERVDIEEEVPKPTPEAPKTKSSGRYTPRIRSQSTSQPRVKPTSASASAARSQFTLREKDTSSTRSSFRRPSTSSPSRRRTKQPEATSTPSRPKPPRLRTSQADTTTHSRPNRRYSNTNSNTNSNTRSRGSSRSRFRGGETTDFDTYTYSQPSFDGTITVTHRIPTEVTIPVVNGKVTEYRNVVTASASTEVLGPHQYTSSAGRDGNPVLLLTSEVTGTLPSGVTEITQYLLHETPTSSVIFTPTTIRGRKTSYSHLIPSTVYDVEQVVSTIQPQIAPNAPLANILLSQLLLGNLGGLQPNLNPLLALTNAATPPTPTTEYKTRATTYVTTVTKGTSTVIPLTFRGKEILTTIVDSSEEVITATEFITDTVVITPTATAANNQLNSLLIPALLQAQLLGNQQGMQQQQQQVTANPLFAGLQQQQLLQQQPQLLEPQKNLFQEPDNEEPIVEEEKPASRRPSQKRNRNRSRPVEEPDRQARESEKDFLQEDTVLSSKEDDQSHSSWKPPRKKNPRNHNVERKPPDNPPILAETSVVTLYVSGRRPGEFSTVLSTVTLGEESSIRKRETGHAGPLVLPVETSRLPELGASFQMDNYVQSAMNELGLESSETETQSLESIVGDVSSYVSVTKKLNAKPSVTAQPSSISRDDASSIKPKKNTGHFLSKGPAELAPLKRKVESSLYRGTETNKKAIVKSKLSHKLNFDDNKEISLSRERRNTDEQIITDTTSKSPVQRRRRVRVRVPVHKKLVDHEEVLSLSEAQHMEHVTDMELTSPIVKGKKQAAVSLSDFGLKLLQEPVKDDSSEHHRKRIIITRRRKPSSSTALLETTTSQPVLQTETPEPPTEKVSKPNARRRIVVTKKRPIPVVPTSTTTHRRRIVITRKRPVQHSVIDADESHEDVVPTSVMDTKYLQKYTVLNREKANDKIMKTSPMFMSGNIPPAFISHYDDNDDVNVSSDDEEEVDNDDKVVTEKEENIYEITSQIADLEVTSPFSLISHQVDDSPIITIKPFLERPNVNIEAVVKHVRPLTQGKSVSKVNLTEASYITESLIELEDTTVGTSTVDYLNIPKEILEAASEHPETTTSMVAEVTDEDKVQLKDEVKIMEEESITTFAPDTEQGSALPEGTTEVTGEETTTDTPEESVIVTTPEPPETSTYEGPKFFRPTRFSITRRPQRTRTSFPGRRRTSDATSSSTATHISSKSTYRFRKPSSTRTFGRQSKTQGLLHFKPSTTIEEVKPTTSPLPETTEAQTTEVSQETTQMFIDEDTKAITTTEGMDSTTKLDSTPPLKELPSPKQNEPVPSLSLSSQNQEPLPTELVTTEDQFVTRTVTRTRLRTYTYIVTRVAGTDELVTSTTEVKPHVTTVTLTQPLPVQTDLAARGLSLSSNLNEARYNLATKVMSNGVEVIVAGDKSTLPGDPDVLRVLSSGVKPTTLAPSTLTDHMMMLLPQDNPETSSQHVTKTLLTTFTYLTTYMQNGHTSVASREHTVTSVATEDPGLGPSEVHTGLTVTSTVTDAIQPTTTDVLKTYFVTYTYYNTRLEGGQTVVRSEVATSSDVVTEKVYLSPKRTTTSSQESVLQTEPLHPLYVFATKTYLTTFTYFTTLLQAAGHDSTSTIVSSRTRVVQNIVTDIIPPSLLGSDYLLSLQNSFSGTPIVATATLSGGQQMTITAMDSQGTIIKPSATVTVEQTASVDLTSSMGEVISSQELTSSMEDHTININNIITGSTIIFFDDDDYIDSSSSAPGTVAIDVPGGQTEATPALIMTPSAQNTVINTGAATVVFPVTPQALTSLTDANVPTQAVTNSVNEPVVKPPSALTTILATSTVTTAGTTLRPGDEVIMVTQSDGTVTMIPVLHPLNKHPSGGQLTGGPGGSEIQVSDLLSLGSLGINGFNALGPVINAMAGLIQSNLQHSDIRRNDTKLPEVAEVPRPVYVASSPPSRRPVYIPLGGVANGAGAESQNYEDHVNLNGENLGWKLQGEGDDEIFPDTQQRHRPEAASVVMGRPTLGKPLLGDGIAISPGQVITANSDVIIGKPAILGPRPPKVEAPIGMRPPPLPIWGDNSDKHKFPGGLQPLRDEPPVDHIQNHPGNHHGSYHPLRGDQKPMRPSSAGSDHRPVLIDNIPLSHQFQHHVLPANVIHEIPLHPIQSDTDHVIQSNSVKPVLDSTTGQSLLVNIQPSQVANILVQQGSIAPEHDPGPFPLPELSPDFVGYNVDPLSHHNLGGNHPGPDTKTKHHGGNNHQGTNTANIDINYNVNHGTNIGHNIPNNHNGHSNPVRNVGNLAYHNSNNTRPSNNGQQNSNHGSSDIHNDNNVEVTGSNRPLNSHHGGGVGNLIHHSQNTGSLGDNAMNFGHHSSNGEFIGHNNYKNENIVHQTENNRPSNDYYQNYATGLHSNNHHSNKDHHGANAGSFGHPTLSNGPLNQKGTGTSPSGHHNNFHQIVNTRPIAQPGHHDKNNAALNYHNTDLDIHNINSLPFGVSSLNSYPSKHHEGDTGVYGSHSSSTVPFEHPAVDTQHFVVDSSTQLQHGVGTVHEETDTDTRMDPETGINIDVSPGSDFNVEVTPGHFQQHGISEHGIVLDSPLSSRPNGPTNKRPGPPHRPLQSPPVHRFPHRPPSTLPHRPMDFMTPPPPPPHTGTSPIIIPLNPNSPHGPRPKPEDLLISADKDDSGEANDPVELEGGEVIQASNSRPLRPGQLPGSPFIRRPTQKPEEKFTPRPTLDEMLQHNKPEGRPPIRWPPPLGSNHHKVSGKPHTASPGFNQYQKPTTNNQHPQRPRPGPASPESSTLDESQTFKPQLGFGQKPPPLPNFNGRPHLPGFDNKDQSKPSTGHKPPQLDILPQPPHFVKLPSETNLGEGIIAEETHSPPPKIDISSVMSTVDKPPKPLFDLETQANTPRPFIHPPDLEKISDDSVLGMFPPPPHITVGSNSGIRNPELEESTHRPVVNIGGQRRPTTPSRIKPRPQSPYKFEIHTSTTESISTAPLVEHKTTTNRPPLYEIPGPSNVPTNELTEIVSPTTHRPRIRPRPPQLSTGKPPVAVSIPNRNHPTTSTASTSTITTPRTSTTTASTVSTKATTPKPRTPPPKRPAVVPTSVKIKENGAPNLTLQRPAISPTSVKYTVTRTPSSTSEHPWIRPEDVMGSEIQLGEDIRHTTPAVVKVNKATDHSVIVTSGSKTLFGGLYTKPVLLQIETAQNDILRVTSGVVNDSEESDTSVEIKKNDLGVASSNDDSVVFGIDDDKVVVPTRYITHTQTLTVTTTETTILSSEGRKPSTRTVVLTKTHTSTIVDTVTETETLVRPTSVVATVTTTVSATATAVTTQYPPGSPFDPANFPSFPVKTNTSSATSTTPISTKTTTKVTTTTTSEAPQGDVSESLFVVVNDQHPGNEDGEVARREEAEEVNHAVLLGGVLIAAPPHHNAGMQQPSGVPDSSCRPDCSPSRNELCQRVEGQMRCVCRPGFARMFPDRPCKPTYTYRMYLGLNRLGQKLLRFEPSLGNHTATNFQKLAEASRQGLDRMVMQSDLRDIFHGVVVSGFQPAPKKDGVLVNFYVQLSDNTDEARLKDIFRKSLRSTNYSLGGTELYADKEQVTHLQAEDFDECESPRFHDCSEHARCFNLRGTYTCSCKEGFADLSENALFPGRICSAEQIGCEKCHYHGTCYSRGDDQVLCECFQWYAGESCHINLKVLLIALVTIGALLLMLLLVCVVLTCLKRSHRKQGKPPGFLRYRGPTHQTLDKRAMIQDTSSEGSVDNGPPPPIAYMTPTQQPVSVFAAKVRQQAVGPNTLQSSVYNTDQRDRSLTVMIPRAKYRPVPPTSPMLTMSTFGAEEKRAIAQEQKLLALLEGKQGVQDVRTTSSHRKPGPAPSPPGDPVQPRKTSAPRKASAADRPQRSSDGPAMPIGALVSAGFEVSATVGKKGSGDSDTEASVPALDMASPGSNFTTLRTADSPEATDGATPETQPATGSGVQELTVSEARSFDETTVQAPTKCLHSNYGSGSKPSSHNLNNDEAHTMAERDLGSTFLMPQTHLYKPDRGSDISNFDSL